MAWGDVKKFLGSKTTRIVLLCLAALLLLFAIYKVFFRESDKADYRPTERESRLCRLLSEVEGVGNAEAYITEEEGVPVGAVVVFEGADSILTRMRVMEITARILNIGKNDVQVYPSK